MFSHLKQELETRVYAGNTDTCVRKYINRCVRGKYVLLENCRELARAESPHPPPGDMRHPEKVHITPGILWYMNHRPSA